MRCIIILALLLSVPLTWAGSYKDKKVVGKWYMRSYTGMKEPHRVLELRSNGTGSLTYKGKATKLKWTIDSKKLVHIKTEAGENIDINDNSLPAIMSGTSNKKKMVTLARNKRYAEFMGMVDCKPGKKCIVYFQDRLEEYCKKYNIIIH